jgi:hypothetical protein
LRAAGIYAVTMIVGAGLLVLAGRSIERSAPEPSQSPAPEAATVRRPDAGPAITSPPGDLAASQIDARHREMAVGTWEDFYHGKRTMTLRADGTAGMVIELTGIKAVLFTPRLELEMVWAVEDGLMKRRNVGGNPPEKVDFVNRTYGDRVAERIVEISEDRMLLRDQSGSPEYTWRRVQ